MNNIYEDQLCHAHKLNPMQKRITEAFIKLYVTKPYERISIKEICEQAGIARTTFYNYFYDTWEVKEIIEDNFVYGLLNVSRNLKLFDYTNKSYTLYIDKTIDFLNQHQSLFKLLLVEKLDSSFLKKYKISIKYHYYDLCGGDEAALELVYGYLISALVIF